MLPAKVGLRSSYRDMAKKIGSSAGTIRNRVKKMYSAGILSGSSVFVNPAILGMTGAAYALDVSSDVPKTEVIEQLRKVENILFIHNFRGSMIGMSLVHESENELEDVIDRLHHICGAKTGMLSRVEYPSCLFTLSDRDWKLIFALSEGGFRSYSEISKKLNLSVRTVVRRLSLLRSEGAIMSVPTLNYRAIRGGLAVDIVAVFSSADSKEITEGKIMPFVNDYLIFAGVGKDYVVYNLIVPSVSIATELSTTVSKIGGVSMVRAEFVDEHIDLTRNLLTVLERKTLKKNSFSLQMAEGTSNASSSKRMVLQQRQVG
jgi:DNA-binding Lrp family transcriptional regulator